VRGSGAASYIGQELPSTFNVSGPEESGTCVAPAGPVSQVVCRFALPLDQSKLSVTVDWCRTQPGGACTHNGNRIPDFVSVEARYQYTPLTPFLSQFIGSINLVSRSEMQIACCQQ
jgi:hypothetical protein